jgi:hypothetical protein
MTVKPASPYAASYRYELNLPWAVAEQLFEQTRR